MRFHHTLCAGIGAAAFTGTAFAQTSGAIFNIEAEMHGDWNLTQHAYIPAAQDGHFGLDTLSAFENVPGVIGDNGTTRPAERWSDLWIKVYRVFGSQDGAMIAVDKEVLNFSGYHWSDFHMEIGVGVGPDFQPLPGLSFKTEPFPREELGVFPNPPMYGPAPGTPVTQLWWLEDPAEGYDGVDDGGISLYWLGINIPFTAFTPGPDTGVETAMITLRQHWTPTPGAAGLLGLAGIASLRRRRRA